MTSDDMPNFEAALGLEYMNLAAHGRKEHPARRLSDDLALVIFFGKQHSSVHLWGLADGRSHASENLPFLLDPFFIEDEEASHVIEVFRRLAPDHEFDLYPEDSSAVPAQGHM